MIVDTGQRIVETVQSLLFNSSFSVSYVLTEFMDRLDLVTEANVIEDKILQHYLECCPLCGIWTKKDTEHWNPYKKCCQECANLDD